MSDSRNLTKAEIYEILLESLGDRADVRWQHGWHPRYLLVRLGPSNYSLLVEPIDDKISVQCVCFACLANNREEVVTVGEVVTTILKFLDHEGVPWPG